MIITGVINGIKSTGRFRSTVLGFEGPETDIVSTDWILLTVLVRVVVLDCLPLCHSTF